MAENEENVYTLTITKIDDDVVEVESTDEGFKQIENQPWSWKNYAQFKSVSFVDKDNNVTPSDEKRHKKGFVAMPLLAFDIYDKELSALTDEEKRRFPVCPENEPTKSKERAFGIFNDVDTCAKVNRDVRGNSNYAFNEKFCIRSYRIFSSITFVQECLKRFGNPGDKFVLEYKLKSSPDVDNSSEEAGSEPDEHFEATASSEPDEQTEAAASENNMPGAKEANTAQDDKANYQLEYSWTLLQSKNIIFRGAPGTGKTYLAKQIACDIITNGKTLDEEKLTSDQKDQMAFVQFHPSYDYTDFVEGLRPKLNDDGSSLGNTLDFELRPGVFKEFVEKARNNYEELQKTPEKRERDFSVEEAINEFLSSNFEKSIPFETKNKTKFSIDNYDEKLITVCIPEQQLPYGRQIPQRPVVININTLRELLNSNKEFENVNEIPKFLRKSEWNSQWSYYFAIYSKIKDILDKQNKDAVKPEKVEQKKYIFIIDEINRGEISKIFGELFFSVDPGYRGKKGEISTQFDNMHPGEKFYIPDNVYIIGTMNDIDRSVDSFDFAMRRRFRFIELKADDRKEILDELGDKKDDAVKHMQALNKAISTVEDLNDNYHIGPAYFLKLKDLGYDFDKLWKDFLEPLLQEYVRGMYNEKGIMEKFKKAYNPENNLAANNADADSGSEEES